MSGLFEHIAQFDDGQRVAGRQAAAVAQKRISDRFGSYLKIAKSAEEYTARLGFVEDDVRQIVADVAAEYDADIENLQEAIDDHLKGDGVTDLNGDLEEAPSAVGHKAAGGHASDCTCGFCKNKGKLPGSKKDDDSDDSDSDSSDSDSKDDSSDDDGDDKPDFLDKDSSTKVADADRDGGGAVTREKLPKGDGKSVGTKPSPKIDKKQWKPNALNDSGNLKVIDSEGTNSPVPTENQDIADTATYESQGEEGDSFLDQTDSVVEQQTLPTADESGQSTERNISQDGQDGTWGEAQNDPVTSEVLSSTEDPDKNPLRTILESGFASDEQVESAIRDFDSR